MFNNMDIKITVRGVILALKNIGTFVSTFTVSGIRRDPWEFVFLFITYMCINTPTDILLLSYWNNNDNNKDVTEETVEE
jgi:hypothetical protein